jgi:hypothetical protein
VTYTNYGALLWWVHRHPRRPRLELLADLEGDRHTGEFWQEFGVAVQRALSETDADRRVLGSWPHFLQVFDSTLLEAVIGGVCAYAAAVRSDAELRSAAATLIRHAGDPWEMLDAERAQPDASEGNAVEEWCFALTNEDVIAGMQLFMRSAWEVAKQLVQDDGSADATVLSNVRHGFNEIVYSARERALGDYTFRKETRPLVQSAVGAERRRQRAPRPNHGSGRPAGVMVRPKGAANERPDPTPRP